PGRPRRGDSRPAGRAAGPARPRPGPWPRRPRPAPRPRRPATAAMAGLPAAGRRTRVRAWPHRPRRGRGHRGGRRAPSRRWLRRWRSADRWPSAWRVPVVSAPRRPCRARPGRTRRGIPVGGGEPRAAAAQVVELALHALLGGIRLLGAVAVGQLLEHLRLAAGQQQARALDVAELAALVDDPG